MYQINEIGIVKSNFIEPEDPFKMKKEESTIIIHKKYEEGLYKIEQNKYLQIIFHFNKSKGYTELKGPTYTGKVKGIFASRSQFRPSAIGLTTVELLERNGRFLRVKGLDAIDGTPIFDIKPFALAMDTYEKKELKNQYNLRAPRLSIMKLIRRWDLEKLLKQAAVLHGHFCPGLAIGVMADAYMVKERGWDYDGMEKVLVIVENNNCAVDGIQFITGCSLGNNALIYRDFGKTAFTFTNRNGEGIRLSLKHDFKENIPKEFSEYNELFDRVIKERIANEKDLEKFKKLAQKISFIMININIKQIFNIEKVITQIPEYAPIFENFICSECGENTMIIRAVQKNGKKICISCAKESFNELSGFGINNVKWN